MIITVTMNAALDRILTVPNFQRGQRHRASERLTLAGGKGVAVARALKRLGLPVVATGLAGGRNGRRILEELQSEGILNDFVRIEDESRTSTEVVDPTSMIFTEINEWGPRVAEDELEQLREKIDYLSRGASLVVLAGSLPRGVDEDFYAQAVRELNRRSVLTLLDAEGDPLRRGIDAEPYLVSPNQQEAEALVGQDFSEEEDFVLALDHIAELGARNVLITHEGGCFGRLRGARGRPGYYRALAPHLETVSATGSGTVLLAGFIAAQLEDAAPDEALRKAVAAGAASTLDVGAGHFEPEVMGRLLPEVAVQELEPATSY
jgi:1-phosphofructokinase family hexose kinase